MISSRLGIIPLGTTNVLGRELGHSARSGGGLRPAVWPEHDGDDRRHEGQYQNYFTQIGIGIDAVMIRDTPVDKSGGWASSRISGPGRPGSSGSSRIASRSRRTASGRGRVPSRSCWPTAGLGTSGLRWGSTCEWTTAASRSASLGSTLLDYLSVGWNVVRGRHRDERNIQYLTAKRAVAIHTERPIPVQGDGEVIGETPLEVQVVPGALRVVVPSRGTDESRPAGTLPRGS